MERKNISSGSTFERKVGYSGAVVKGNWVFVSGTTGFDYTDMSISNTVEEQTEQCFRNIALALEKAESKLEDIIQKRDSYD